MFNNLDNNTIIILLFIIFVIILLYKECAIETFTNENNDIDKLRNLTKNIKANDNGVIVNNKLNVTDNTILQKDVKMTNGNFRLFNHSNKQGGKIEAYDQHHSIYLRKGYRNEHDELNLHEFGSINMFTGGAIQDQKKRMKIANNGNIELYNNLKINGQTDMGDTLNINGNIIETSDVKLKKNIKKMNSKSELDKITKLSGYQYKKIINNQDENGLIAQQVEQLYPELVKNNNGYKGISYNRLIPSLVESIKEQQLQINDLKSKL